LYKVVALSAAAAAFTSPLDQAWTISLLTKGTFGRIYRCTHTTTNETYALKEALSPNKQQALDNEIKILYTLNLMHPNIIQAAVTANSPQRLMMPWYKLSLFVRLSQKTILSDPEKITIQNGLIAATSYLHDQSPAIVHRDIKPANILLNDNQPILCDFGSALLCPTSYTEAPAKVGTKGYQHNKFTPYTGSLVFSTKLLKEADWVAATVTCEQVNLHSSLPRNHLGPLTLSDPIAQKLPKPEELIKKLAIPT